MAYTELNFTIESQELWDEFSEYIDTDIDSLQHFAGSSIITHVGYKNMMDKLSVLLSQQKGKELFEWVKASEMPDKTGAYICKKIGNLISEVIFDKQRELWINYHGNVVEWLKPVIIEQKGNINLKIDFTEGIIAEDTEGFVGVIEGLKIVETGKTKQDVLEECLTSIKVLLAYNSGIDIRKGNIINDSDGWISVKDKLPEHDQKVLAVFDTENSNWYTYPTNCRLLTFCIKSTYNKFFREASTLFEVNSEKVIYWRPLPAPPENKKAKP